MNEAETSAELIDPALKAAGWGVVEGSRIRREYPITLGRIEGQGRRGKPLTADYVLVYRNTKLAVIEAKADGRGTDRGRCPGQELCGQARPSATLIPATGGHPRIDMEEGTEGEIAAFPSPDELWNMTFVEENAWRDRFAAVPFEDKGGYLPGRVLPGHRRHAGHGGRWPTSSDRILLTLATGTGKTFIAFQIAWKLFYSRWNLSREPSRRPRILFLADRNILANQGYNAFPPFPKTRWCGSSRPTFARRARCQRTAACSSRSSRRS